MAAAAMLGLGIAVVGGGVAFAGDAASSGTPASTVPGVISNYRVDTPTIQPIPIAPVAPVMVQPNDFDWT